METRDLYGVFFSVLLLLALGAIHSLLRQILEILERFDTPERHHHDV